MSRTFVSDIAKEVGLHPQTIRNLVDKGVIKAERDYNNWRWFPRPDETIRKVNALLYGQTETVSAVESAAHRQ